MNKTFKKTYVAVGAALTLFAALSLTLTPSIAWALTASAPLTAADGAINLPIEATTTNACGASKRLSVVQTNGAPALKCVANPTDNEGVTSVTKLANSTGLEVDNTTATTPVLSLLDCDPDEILVAGNGTSDYACADQPSVTAIPAVITFRTNTSISAPSSGTKVLYASLSGDLSSTEPTVHTPLPSGNYTNITCRASSAAGAGNTVKLFSGPCGSTSAFSSGNVTVTLPTTGTNKATGSGTTAVDGTNTCAVVKISVGTSYAGEFINCSVEKTS